jgi:hypothetical protein
MIQNEIDTFRTNFFERLIKDEEEKEATLKRKQINCTHLYNIIGETTFNNYQTRSCSKCEHSVTKSLQVWNGSKYGSGTCIIS